MLRQELENTFDPSYFPMLDSFNAFYPKNISLNVSSTMVWKILKFNICDVMKSMYLTKKG